MRRRPPEMMDVFPPTSFQMRCPRHHLPRPRASSRRKERGPTWLRTKERQQVTTTILLVQIMVDQHFKPSSHNGLNVL
uniref:Uncharacterized protein n=1 Tax=Triticum urartu TaxID=4572 RepID=A0A8R7PWT8_TRIUA